MAALPETDPEPNNNGSRSSGLALVASAVLIMASVAGGTYLLRSEPSRKDTSSEPQQAEASDVITSDDPEQLLEQRRQSLRTQLQAIVVQGDSISDDIDALQSEIEAYRQQSDLILSEHGDQLASNKWAGRYFFGGGAERLPHNNLAKHCRMRLDTLMLTVEKALSQPGVAYEVSSETLKNIEQVQVTVSQAKEEYARHRLLLEALSEATTEEPTSDPETVSDRATIVFRELMEDGTSDGPGRERAGGQPPVPERQTGRQ
jgi:hypothetical protein